MLQSFTDSESLKNAVKGIDDNLMYSVLYDRRVKKYYLESGDGGMIRSFETLLCQGTGKAVRKFIASHISYVASFAV